MKKYILTIISAAILCGLCSCGDKTSDTDSIAPTTAASTTSATTTEEATTAAATTAAAATTTATAAASVGAPIELDYTPEGADLSAFHYNEDGAVVFDKPVEEQSDATLMAAAQALFQSAHALNSHFAMGSFPYHIDFNGESVTKTNPIDGQELEYFLIKDEDVNSIDDVIADYRKVFSDKYDYNIMIDTCFTEEGGRVYCISGGRGSDIEYVGSEIVSYDGKNGDELMFTVRNHYDGTQWGGSTADYDHDFTMVNDADGVWRAGRFIQPD